jgi:hypothetical protein
MAKKEEKKIIVSKQDICRTLKYSCQNVSVNSFIVNRGQLKTALGDIPKEVFFNPDDDGKSEVVKVKRIELHHELEKTTSESKKETEVKK